ncbi:MAG: carbohydrate ABC transporter permease [Lachnospiraceae bacterium]
MAKGQEEMEAEPYWYLFSPAGLFGTVCFALAPFCRTVVRSFQNALGTAFVGLENYRMILGNTAFQIAAGNTPAVHACVYSVAGRRVTCAICCFAETNIHKKRTEKYVSCTGGGFRQPQSCSYGSCLFHSNGLLNRALLATAGWKVEWMTTSASFWVLVLSYLWKNLGYDMILWMAGLAGIPEEIYEAAHMDGAGERACFFRITLPNVLPSLYTISVLSFLNSFKVFREAWLVAGDYPQQDMYLLQHLYNNWFRDLAFDKISAAAVLTALVVCVLILLLQRAWEREI